MTDVNVDEIFGPYSSPFHLPSTTEVMKFWRVMHRSGRDDEQTSHHYYVGMTFCEALIDDIRQRGQIPAEHIREYAHKPDIVTEFLAQPVPNDIWRGDLHDRASLGPVISEECKRPLLLGWSEEACPWLTLSLVFLWANRNYKAWYGHEGEAKLLAMLEHTKRANDAALQRSASREDGNP